MSKYQGARLEWQDFKTVVPEVNAAVQALSQIAAKAGLDKQLLELIKIRASQINGCAFCLEMHHHDAVEMGETATRLALLPAWRESELYTREERLGLALTEAVTRIADGDVAVELEDEARKVLGDEGYAAVIFAIVAINSWNRLAIAGHKVPGSLREAAAS